MNRSPQRRQFMLIVLLIALLWPHGLLRAQAPGEDVSSEAGEKVKLYYMREATKINLILTPIATANNSVLNGLIFKNATEDEIILYGPKEKRAQARRIIATLDLPRPGIIMEMWGIQVTSKNPDQMARAMALVRQEINRTQQAVRETYSYLEVLTRRAIPPTDLTEEFRKVLADDLFYRSALSLDHPLALADILLRMTAAKNPGVATVNIANGLEKWLGERHPEYLEELNKRSGKVKNQKIAVKVIPPFERFFSGRGLTRENNKWEDGGEIALRANIARIAVLEFALQYGRLIHQPQSFDPYYLQQASEALNTRLQDATDALNLDMQDLFVAPTLDRIREIVRRFKDVEYAQVGKTTVASLSGVQADVTTRAVNTFNVTPPLTLSEVLQKASTLSSSVNPFIPKPADNMVGAMPLSQVIGLIGAFGEERSVFRELQSGISLTITPNVLRNMTSAELRVVLQIGDPQVTAPPQTVKPLSRVSQHNVTTSIYVNPLDFFDLSAFASQSTLDGGRGYVPILGPVWRGLFGEVPIAGKLFSWRRGTKNVFSESLVLTTSFITPTSMGIAVLYPTEVSDENGHDVKYDQNIYNCQWKSVRDYKNNVSVLNGQTCLRPKSE
jgi:hypothetical protein